MWEESGSGDLKLCVIAVRYLPFSQTQEEHMIFLQSMLLHVCRSQ